jgi:hypothetical protein
LGLVPGCSNIRKNPRAEQKKYKEVEWSRWQYSKQDKKAEKKEDSAVEQASIFADILLFFLDYDIL